MKMFPTPQAWIPGLWEEKTMTKMKLSEEELRAAAKKLGIPLNEAVLEDTRKTLEGWLNDTHDVSEEMRKDEYDDVIPASLTSF